MIAIPALALALIGACAQTSEEDQLELVEDGAKTDVVRPFGTWKQTVSADEGGFTLLRLDEDRTYDASQELIRCTPGACTDAFGGTFRFASSSGKPYIVLYNEGDWWYSFEYKMTSDALALRVTGTSQWFSLAKAASGLEIGEADAGKTLDVTEGDDVILKLPSNPSTGFKWVITSTDRSFGYGEETYELGGDAVGSGGTSVFTWKTQGFFPLVGMHTVTLEYKRPFDTTQPPAKTFTFSVNVVAP